MAMSVKTVSIAEAIYLSYFENMNETPCAQG